MNRLSGGGRVLAGIAALVVLVAAIAVVALSRPSPETPIAASPTGGTASPSAAVTPSPGTSHARGESVAPVGSPSDMPTPTVAPASPSVEPARTAIGPWTVLGSGDEVEVLWSPGGQHLLILRAAVNGPPNAQVLTLATAEGDVIRTYFADLAVWLDDQRFLFHHWERVLVGEETWTERHAEDDINELIGQAFVGEVASGGVDEVDLPPYGLSNGTGTVTFRDPKRFGSDTRYRIWSADGWSKYRRGHPAAWSHAGDRLALLHLVDDWAVKSMSAAALVGDGPGRGGQPQAGFPGPHGWLEVVAWPAMTRVHSDRDLDFSNELRFDPSGAFIVSYSTIVELASGHVVALRNEDVFGYSFAWDDAGRVILPDRDGDGVAYTTDGREAEVWPDVGDSAVASADGSTVVFFWGDRDGMLPLTILRDGGTVELDLPSVDGDIGDDVPDGAFTNCHEPRVSPDGTRVAIVCVTDRGYTGLITEP